jgi:16S rRNA (cytosine967-C5)-methyltransferase
MISPARTVAFDVLLQVERGGYASGLLLSRAAPLDSRDASLAHELVFGVLRYRAQLDYLTAHYSGRARKLDPEVRNALRMGIYQVRYLDRVPRHAAVAQSVDLVKRARKHSAAGFVNAVLRKADRAPVSWPTREIALSCPEWLLARWEARYGRECAESIARAALQEPEKYLRGGRIQDIGSQSIVPLLQLQPGQAFLDLCAAPGNKTAQALESGVRAIAADLHLHRIAGMKDLATPLVVLDGTKPLPFSRPFDRILVDAPCSGTGTLGRNPEIKWRLRPADLDDLRARQQALLANALSALAPGGLIVYSTCSLEPEENEAVIAALPPDRILETMHRIPGRDPGDGFFAAVIANVAHALQPAASSLLATPGVPPHPGTGPQRESSCPCDKTTCSLEPEENEAVIAALPPDRILETMHRIPGRDPGDGFFAAVIAGVAHALQRAASPLLATPGVPPLPQACPAMPPASIHEGPETWKLCTS